VEVRECVEENFVFLRSLVSIAQMEKVNHRVVDNVSARAGVVVMERIMPLKPSLPPIIL
jgi:hypothetical protein